MNDFIDTTSISRSGNENIIDFCHLESMIRKFMDPTCKRTLAVLNPLKIIIDNIGEEEII